MALPTSSNAKVSAKAENSKVLSTEPLVWTPSILIERKVGLIFHQKSEEARWTKLMKCAMDIQHDELTGC